MRKHYLFTAVLLLALVLASVASASPAVAANNGLKVQLAMILDGSASIGSSNWGIIKEGLASAIENTMCVPHDGSVELTVVEFGYYGPTYARVEVAPTVIDSDATAAAVAAAVRAMPHGNDNTPMAHGIKLAADTLRGSTNFDPSLKQALNLVTDGNPNVCHPDWPCPPYNDNAVSARNYAISLLGMDTDPQDELDAEAIGTTPDVTWLRDNIIWPQPGYDTWPPPGPGWVRVVADATEFAETICEKFEIIIPTGSITIIKEVVGEVPDSDWEFSGTAPIGSFSLAAAGDSTTFSDLDAGSYTITETTKTGYTTSVSCDTGESDTNSVTIDLDPGEDVICTFTNTAQKGSITIEKQTDPEGGMGFEFSGGLGDFTLDDGGSTSFSDLAADNYDVTEVAPEGWELTSVVCTGGDCTAITDGVTIHLDPGEDIRCTFTNEERVPVMAIINLTKTPTDGAGHEITQAYVGDTIVYVFEVENPGVPNLINVTLSDDTVICDTGPVRGADKVGNNDNTLEPAEIWVYTCSHLVTADDPDPLDNHAIVSGEDPQHMEVTDDDDATVDIVTGPPPVGGEAYPVNKLAILVPWITLAVLLAGSISWFALRRREARS